jgi:hypothetical protein
MPGGQEYLGGQGWLLLLLMLLLLRVLLVLELRLRREHLRCTSVLLLLRRRLEMCVWGETEGAV